MEIYLVALGLTILIESFSAALLGYREQRFLLGVVLVNIFSHPLLSAFLEVNRSSGLFIDPLSLTLLLEAGVVIVEGYLLKDTFALPGLSAYRLSLFMNAASFMTGVLLFGI